MIANGRLPWEVSVTSRREPLSRASTRHGHFCFSLTLSGGSCGGQSLPHEGVAGDRRAPGQGKTFPFWLPKFDADLVEYAIFCGYELATKVPLYLFVSTASRCTQLYLTEFIMNFGAGEGILTLDPNLGKVVIYP